MITPRQRAEALMRVAQSAEELEALERTIAERKRRLEEHIANAAIAGFAPGIIASVTPFHFVRVARARDRALERRRLEAQR